MEKFIIVGTPRTGSSLLAQVINFHPEVACGWQWTSSIASRRKIQIAQRGLDCDFSELPGGNDTFMEEILTPEIKHIGYRSLFRSSDKWVIHPRFCPAFWVDRLEQHINWIEKNPNISIVHITRNDNLAWLKSYLFSRLTHNYIGEPYQDGLSIKPNKTEVIARVRSKHWLDKQLERLNNSNPYFRVEYESLSDDKLNAGKSVIKFFGCDPRDFTINEAVLLGKQSRGHLRDGIENYDELVSALTKRNLLRASFSI